MSSEALWALGRGNGIVALAFMTLSVVLGIGVRSGRPLFTLPRFGIADVHRFVALAATLLVALHMGLLFMDPYAKLRLIDFVVPFLGAYRPLWQGLGTVAFDVLVLVVITSVTSAMSSFGFTSIEKSSASRPPLMADRRLKPCT